MSLMMVMSRCSPNKFLVISECMALELAPKTSEVQNLTSISSARAAPDHGGQLVDERGLRLFQPVVGRERTFDGLLREHREGFLPQINGDVAVAAASVW